MAQMAQMVRLADFAVIPVAIGFPLVIQGFAELVGLGGAVI
jgi:hypothetical protein